jgi:hypothetical protein
MIIRADHVALYDLSQDAPPANAAGYQRADLSYLVALVVKLKHDNVNLTAVNTWMLEQVPN